MSTWTDTLSRTQRQLVRYAKSPKGTLLLLFAGITAIALQSQGFAEAGPGLAIIVGAAAVLDVLIVGILRDRLEFPDGAILTGLIIALVLRPQEPVTVELAAAGIAIGAKHLLRTRWSNVFNPAALGLVGVSVLFNSGQSWWGGLPDLGFAGIALISAAGLFIVDRVNKLPLALTFLGTYFTVFTVASFFQQPLDVAEVFRTPDLQAALFFAFFMLDDPPTCPARYQDQLPFAVIVALASYFVFAEWGVVYFLAAGLLAGNAWESARRQLVGPLRELRRRLESGASPA